MFNMIGENLGGFIGGFPLLPNKALSLLFEGLKISPKTAPFLTHNIGYISSEL